MNNISSINPATLGPALFSYSQGVCANAMIFVSGQAALDQDNNVVAPGEPYEQTKVTIDRIRKILADAGATLNDVVSCTVYITSLDHLSAFNKAWEEAFGSHRPARAVVVAGLLLAGLVVEIQAIAIAK